ncbi:hypothetical protein N802_03320 [Knoellia sinensis KCTC 19936]|uniref:Uncharacterized protein n=1 Tax=Knoellia sinensis KCTC 19936 TaxID=1385520 RepID=A0A0A0J3I7_9MICO|nr:hypothetical protein N802_03320 [Knoellia sinensis KCTC 19936]
MTPEGPSGHLTARPEVVRRLLQSEPFARSRRRAELIDGDHDAMSELVDLVRLRHVEEDVHLAPIAGLVEETLTWLATPEVAGDQSPSVTARRRMAIAALNYLYDVDDVIPDDRRDGTIDDFVVLQAVLSRSMGGPRH